MIVRHRLDLAKLYLGKDGGYSLRKFKRIFKREMEENPDKYLILRPNTKFEKNKEAEKDEDEFDNAIED